MGEYEPEDSRNVTGTASTPDGRWTNTAGKPPKGVPNPGDQPATTKPHRKSDARKSDTDTGETGGDQRG